MKNKLQLLEPRSVFATVNEKYPNLTFENLSELIYSNQTQQLGRAIVVDYLNNGLGYFATVPHPLLQECIRFVEVGARQGILGMNFVTDSIIWMQEMNLMTEEIRKQVEKKQIDHARPVVLKNTEKNPLGFLVFTPTFIMQCRNFPVESLAELLFLTVYVNKLCNVNYTVFQYKDWLNPGAFTAEFLYQLLLDFPDIAFEDNYLKLIELHIPSGKG